MPGHASASCIKAVQQEGVVGTPELGPRYAARGLLLPNAVASSVAIGELNRHFRRSYLKATRVKCHLYCGLFCPAQFE